MPQKPVQGTGQVNAELPVELLDQLKEFAKSRGEKVREVIEMALRRHMANPPPPPVPLPPPAIVPLPPMTADDGASTEVEFEKTKQQTSALNTKKMLSLIEPLLGKLERWANEHDAKQSPAAIRGIANDLRSLFLRAESRRDGKRLSVARHSNGPMGFTKKDVGGLHKPLQEVAEHLDPVYRRLEELGKQHEFLLKSSDLKRVLVQFKDILTRIQS